MSKKLPLVQSNSLSHGVEQFVGVRKEHSWVVYDKSMGDTPPPLVHASEGTKLVQKVIQNIADSSNSNVIAYGSSVEEYYPINLGTRRVQGLDSEEVKRFALG